MHFISSLTSASGSVLHVTKLSYLAARPSLAPRPLHVLFFFFCLTDRPHFTRGGRWETKHFTGMALCICLLVWLKCTWLKLCTFCCQKLQNMAPMLQSKLRHLEAYQGQGGRRTRWKHMTGSYVKKLSLYLKKQKEETFTTYMYRGEATPALTGLYVARSSILVKLEFGMLVFVGGAKLESLEKKPLEQVRTWTTQPTDAGIEPILHWLEADLCSHHNAIPAPQKLPFTNANTFTMSCSFHHY